MPKIEFILSAADDYRGLDKSIRLLVNKKISALKKNPFLGEPLGLKFNIDLTGFFKLYIDKKRYRIVYRIVGDSIEIIEIWGIGKRDKEEIYRLMGRRIKRQP